MQSNKLFFTILRYCTFFSTVRFAACVIKHNNTKYTKCTYQLSALPKNTELQILVLPQPNMFLPRCMECRRGLAMRILSVRLSNACIVTKRKVCPDFFIPYERSFDLLF